MATLADRSRPPLAGEARSGAHADAAARSRALPRELQLMWLDLLHRRWRSLALVPVDPGPGARQAAEAAVAVAEFFALERVQLIDARGATLADADRLGNDMRTQVGNGSRVVVVVDPPLSNAGAISPAMAAEAVVLVARLGITDLAAMRGVIEIVRRDRILGSVALHGGAPASL